MRMASSRQITMAAVFGVIVFFSKAFAPTPYKDSFVVVQALLLGLGALMIPPLGATLVSTIAGFLIAGWSPSLAVFSISFSILYGLMLDGLLLILHPMRQSGTLSTGRFTAALTFSTAAIGIIAYGATLSLRLLPRNPAAEVAILAAGIVSGLIGGYLGAVIWRRAARHMGGKS